MYLLPQVHVLSARNIGLVAARTFVRGLLRVPAQEEADLVLGLFRQPLPLLSRIVFQEHALSRGGGAVNPVEWHNVVIIGGSPNAER